MGITLGEPECSWQQSGRKSPRSGRDKGEGVQMYVTWERCDKNLCGPGAIYKAERPG